MALAFNVMVNNHDVEFLFNKTSGTIQITAIDGQPRSVICQTLLVKTLDEAKEQARILTDNKANTLFWHPV
jgi:hypothetical protein